MRQGGRVEAVLVAEVAAAHPLVDTRSLHDVLDAGAARAVLRELAAVASSSERLSVTH
jgi:hypothetical protein